VEIDDDTQTAVLPERSDVSVDPAIVERALQAGRAVTCTEEQAPEAGLSAAESGERSVLCVPIRVRGRIVACLYVTHGHVRELFGPDEERLAPLNSHDAAPPH